MKSWLLGAATLTAALAAAGVTNDNLAAQSIDAEMRPLPGQYNAKITFLSIDMPGAPPQMADMMSQMMSRDIQYCLTPEEIEEGYRSMFRQSQEGDCTIDRYNAVNGELDALMTCRGDGRTITMEMEGTGSSTSSDITMTMSGDFGMGPGSMKLRAQHERIGECS